MKLSKEISNGRKIYLGDINNGIYSRQVTGKHKYTYIDKKTGEESIGWTVDKDAFEQHILSKCQHLIIKDTESSMTYSCTVLEFSNKAIPLHDRYFLAISEWKSEKDKKVFKKVEVVLE